MKMHIVSFKKTHHFPLMVEWLNKRNLGKEGFSADYLPPVGVVVCVDERPAVIAFVTLSDSKIAIRSDVVSDPDLPLEVRRAAAEKARGVLDAYAKHYGMKVMLAYTKVGKLADRLESLGYTKMQDGLIEMGRLL